MYDKQRISEERRMLQGNINRMCLTDSKEELEDMYLVAIKRIAVIYAENVTRVNDNVIERV